MGTLPKAGHAPGHVRDAFCDWLEAYAMGERPATVPFGYDEQPVTPAWLCGQLWNCTDVLPGLMWQLLAERLGVDPAAGVATYARAARILKARLREEAYNL